MLKVTFPKYRHNKKEVKKKKLSVMSNIKKKNKENNSITRDPFPLVLNIFLSTYKIHKMQNIALYLKKK